MVHGESALRGDAIMAFSSVDFAPNMVPAGSALGSGAPRPLNLEEGVPSTCAARKGAKWKGVILLLLNVVFAASMVHTERASLMAAPPTQELDLNIAPSTAVERRRSRALYGMPCWI